MVGHTFTYTTTANTYETDPIVIHNMKKYSTLTTNRDANVTAYTSEMLKEQATGTSLSGTRSFNIANYDLVIAWNKGSGNWTATVS